MDRVSYYISFLSTDDDGELLLTALEKEKVNCCFSERRESSTEKVFVEVKEGERVLCLLIPVLVKPIKKATSVRDTMGVEDAYCALFEIELFRGMAVGDNNQELIVRCFKVAADQVYNVLQYDGAFSHGIPIN